MKSASLFLISLVLTGASYSDDSGFNDREQGVGQDSHHSGSSHSPVLMPVHSEHGNLLSYHRGSVMMPVHVVVGSGLPARHADHDVPKTKTSYGQNKYTSLNSGLASGWAVQLPSQSHPGLDSEHSGSVPPEKKTPQGSSPHGESVLETIPFHGSNYFPGDFDPVAQDAGADTGISSYIKLPGLRSPICRVTGWL